jgi:hypothetical protein
VRLHVVALPDPVYDRSGYTQVSRKHAYTPVGTAVTGSRLQSRVQNALL